MIPVLGVFLTIIPLLLISVNFIDISSIPLNIPTIGNDSEENLNVLDKTIPILTIKTSDIRTIDLYQDNKLIKQLKTNDKKQNIYMIIINFLSDLNKDRKQDIVFIDISDRIKYMYLIQIIDACRDTGFNNINIIK